MHEYAGFSAKFELDNHEIAMSGQFTDVRSMAAFEQSGHWSRHGRRAAFDPIRTSPAEHSDVHGLNPSRFWTHARGQYRGRENVKGKKRARASG
jgi:hypothetical protein